MSANRVYNFNDVIGNFSTVAVIKSAVANGSFPNFSIMAGDSGTGKSTCAEIVSLRLNCENPVDSNPCLHCESCRVNLASLQGNGNSTRVKKVNLGDSEVRKDLSTMITQIFKLDVSHGKSVFILEEVHSLNEAGQTALLEEIDKLSSNVHVILCTTKPSRLLEELRNRSITFHFSKLKSSESKVLLEKILNKTHIDLPSNVRAEILKHSKGVPRRIVNLVDFVTKNNCDYNTIIDFLGIINPKVFYMLFKTSSDISSYTNYLNELVLDHTIDDLVYNFKKYLMDLHFISAGVSTFYSNTTKQDKEIALEIGKEYLYKIQNLIYSTTIIEDYDFIFLMLKVRSLILQAKNTNKNTINPSINSVQSTTNNQVTNSSALKDSSIYLSPQEVAMKSQMKANSIDSNSKGKQLTPLNLNRLKELND